MKAPALVFGNSKAPQPPRRRPLPPLARKAALLATVRPGAVDFLERLIDDLLDDAGVPRGAR